MQLAATVTENILGELFNFLSLRGQLHRQVDSLINMADIGDAAGPAASAAPSPIECDLCGVRVSSDVQLQQHRAGKAHKKRVGQNRWRQSCVVEQHYTVTGHLCT